VLGGFYDEPLVYFGRLMAEIWRACRLVVDTGLHHFRWTRDQACDYMRTYAGLAEQDIQTEVDRYMVRGRGGVAGDGWWMAEGNGRRKKKLWGESDSLLYGALVGARRLWKAIA
jgi:hypothetical protein